jgi:tetratricopeptide (TPR) repeat protein
LNWNDFFPSQLIFQLIFVLIDLDLDFTTILKRTLRWGGYWKSSKIVNDDHLNALKTFSIELKDDLVFLEIISFLVEKGEIEEAFSFVECINDSYIKYRALIVISTEESIFIALEIGRNIPDFNMKCATLLDISKEFYKKNMIEVGDSLINEIVALGMGIEDGFIRARNLITISSNVLEKGDLILSENLLNQSILITDELIDEISQSNLYLEIAVEFARNGKLLEANKIISRIKDKAYQNSALVEVISVLLKQGSFINAEELLEKIDDNREKNQALVSLAYEAAKIGNIDAVNNFIKTISSQNAREALFRKLAFEFAMKGNRDLSLYYAKNIGYGIYRANVLIDVAVQFASIGLGEDAYSIIQESIVDARGISNNYSRGGVFMKIASELYASGNVADSISAINEFLSNFDVQNSKDKDDLIFQQMSAEFLELGKLKESIAFAWRIDNYSKKITALFAIAKSLFKMNNIIESELILRETIYWINNQLNEDHKGIALYKISLEFAKRADFEKALEIARNISDQYNSSRSLLEISAEMYVMKLEAESNTVLDESHRKMLEMDNFLWKGYALTDVAVEYARRGKIENSFICLQEISGDYRKENALCKISKELALLGKKIESISYVNTINDFNLKSSALLEISKVFFEQNQCDDALKYLNEALSNSNMIEDESLKVTLLISIAIEFDKHNQFKVFLEVIMEAIKSARLIKNKIGFDYALTEISIQLAQRGCWKLIEDTVAEIYNHQMREDCWLKIAVSLNKNRDYYSMRKLINEFSYAESKIQMKQAIIRSVDEVNISKDICIHVLNDRSIPVDLTQHILQMYSMNQLFYTDAKPEKIQRLNRTLNIQWAIDIKNSYSANGS